MDSNSESQYWRRRAVTVEKKSDTGVDGDEMVGKGKDLVHTIRGESVLERSNEISPTKKALVTPTTVGSERRKKALRRPAKPMWLTLLSVLAKNCLLLAALLWVGQRIWKWADNVQEHAGKPFVDFDYDGRVSEIDASLKSMAKMFQVQLDVLDKKIGSEVGGVRREVMKWAEESGDLVRKELEGLEGRVDSLNKSVGEMKDGGFVSKEEFERFWNEWKKNASMDGSEQDVNLDKIRAFARSVIEKEIEKHAADGIGRADYALASGGARVVDHSQPYNFGTHSWSSAFKSRGVHANAQRMLQPSFGEPGQCFGLEGSSGYVHIRLRAAIIPEAITLEHVSKSVAYDRSSAPKEGIVRGWLGEPMIDKSNPPTMYLIARISYDLEKSNIQTFNVEPGIAAPINNVRLDIDSNHGSSALTCIYRFRVHGYEPSSPAATVTEQA